MNERSKKRTGQKPVAWDTFKWYASMSTFCSMPQICMHHLLPVSLRVCLPACPAWSGLAKTVAVAVAVTLWLPAWVMPGPVSGPAVVRQYPPSAAESGPICGFWAAAISCLLPGQLSLALSHRSTRSKSDNCLLCAPLVWGVASSFACNRFTFKSWLCRTHKD